MEYDVIIIGGGLSGLMAGFTAAKRGKKVLLLEKHTTVGGLAAGFWRKGYYFDSGMSRCLSYIKGPLHAAGIDVELKRQRTICNIAGTWANYCCIEQYFADLGGIFPEERSGLQNLYEQEFRHAESMLASFLADFIPENKSPRILRTVRLLGALRSMQTTKSLFETESDVLGRHLNKEGRAYAFLVEREDEVDYRGEMNFFTKAGKLYSQTLNVYPSKGYQAVAEDMAAAIRARHGEVRTRVDVKRIMIEAGSATGVEIRSHGQTERIAAKKVISAIDLKKAFHGLIGDEYLDADISERLGKSRLSRAVPMFHLGVNISPEKIKQHFQGHEEVWYFPEIAPCPTEETFFRSHSMVIHSSCFHNPGHAPAGKTNLQVYLSCPPEGWMDNWGLKDGKRTERYREIKAMVTEDILSTLERIIPELHDRSTIEVCDLGTPFTLERYTGNTEGSCLGFRMDADYINSKKMGQYFDRYAGIANLYFAGQQTGYPGGVLIALQSGQHAGRLV
jgi:phytoene dehydrogenase-like protein